MKRLLIILAAAATLAACGGHAAKDLNADDGVRVANANLALANLCVDLLKGGDVPRWEFAAGSDAMRILTDVFQTHPNEIYLEGRTVRQTIASQANDLQACAPEDSQKLRTLLLGQ